MTKIAQKIATGGQSKINVEILSCRAEMLSRLAAEALHIAHCASASVAQKNVAAATHASKRRDLAAAPVFMAVKTYLYMRRLSARIPSGKKMKSRQMQITSIGIKV